MKTTLNIRNQCDSHWLAVATNPVEPKIDFNYRTRALSDSEGLCAGYCRSPFCTVSQDYFINEAPRHFALEAALFFVIMMTTALPLLSAAIAVLELIRV